MPFTLKHCILVLVAAVAVCIQLNHAQFIPGARCICHKTVKFTVKNITDFQIIDSGPNCPTTQVIITVENPNNSTDSLCLNPKGGLANAFITCWNNENREESKKVTCLNKRNSRLQRIHP